MEAGREAQEKVLFGSFSFKKKNKTPVKICGKAARKTCSETAQRLSRESPSAPKSKRTPLAGESLHPKIDAHPLLRESPSAPKSKHIPSCGRVPPPQNRSARPLSRGTLPIFPVEANLPQKASPPSFGRRALFCCLFLSAVLRWILRGICRGSAPAPRHLLKKVDENFFLASL